MKGLLLKDYYVIKDTLFVQMMILLAIGIAFSFVITPWVFVVISATTFSLYSSTSILSDKTSKWDIYVNTIPVSKEQVIRSKYLLNVLLTATGLLLGLVLATVTSGLLGQFSFEEMMQYSLIALSLSFASASASVPLSILFDDKKQILTMLFSVLIPTVMLALALFIASRFINLQENMLAMAVLFCVTGIIMFLLSLWIAPTLLGKRKV